MGSKLRRGAARVTSDRAGLAVMAGVAALATSLATTPARAGLEICNQTSVHRSIAIGYSQDDAWTSEGWWNLDPGQCATPVEDDLAQRYYYYRAEAEDGSFPGEGYSFCTVAGAFTIVGDEDCEDRGYVTEDFREIDTGEVATTFAHAITDAALETATTADGDATGVVTGPADSGLRICNRTDVERFLAIGYSKDDQWTSEGWWTLEPDQCATPIEGDLTQQFYYYRAEDPDEQFNGEGYVFCAVDDAFTIVGDENCEARGYEELDFREIDTGPEARGYVFVMDADSMAVGSGSSEPPGTDTTSGPADAGLRICNQSGIPRFLAIGYSKDDQWTSEGWWTLDTGECATPVEGDLTQRFYYYRAEDPSEAFEGEGYAFCTVDDAFTIIGDQDCAGRGYEEHDFSEIDTGPEAPGYVFVIGKGDGIPASGARPEAPAAPPSPPTGAGGKGAAAEDAGGPVPTTPSGGDVPPGAPEDAGEDTRGDTQGEVGDDPVERTRAGIQGRWQSRDDHHAAIRFGDGRYFDYYEGDLMADGAYSVAMACPDNPGSGGEDPVIIVRLPGDAAPSCYSVMYMDATSLEMLALPRGNLLRYQRSE
ncbi:DUF1036 domain-containing protein [Roseospira visakhapatnamensis]|uniref:Putative membrane protein n=1 Tax=Roseospira visakhapatnamensis TaxID=390880 RepID=A0A7W6RAC2_9PROT|nr:DUF1036 domain-containing protein [Roseospira visakhapatnamensis]MBB4264451.1 putative membrane protein [Roseospira visakhapatnamensis]